MDQELNSHRKIIKYLINSSIKNINTVFKLFKMLYQQNSEFKKKGNFEFSKEDYFVKKAEDFFGFKNQQLNIENYFYINKNNKISNQDEVLLLAVYCNEDKLSEFQKNLIKAYKSAGYKVLLIIACSDIDFYDQNISNESDIELIRNNLGFDFGSWSNAISVFNNLNIAKSITLTNDSICLINYDIKLLKKLKRKINDSKKDIIFLTENNEVLNHNQSYFFTFKESAIKKGVLENFKYDSHNLDKNEIIRDGEIGMSHFLKYKGYTIDTLYKFSNYKKNILINQWEMLLGESFPFIKLKLFEENFVDTNKIKNKNYLNNQVLDDINSHIQSRGKLEERILYKEYENIKEEKDLNYPPYFIFRPIALDIQDLSLSNTREIKYICILHAFYSDLGINHIKKLIALNILFKLVVTTDDEEKKRKINDFCIENHLDFEVNIHPNKGRDILPFLKELKNLKNTNLPILHIHTKKSPHEEALKDWGKDTLSKLIFNQKNVLSIIEILEKTKIGIVYPDFPKIIKNRINWGYNFKTASSILNDLNIHIDVNDFLLFPAGSMMWFKFDSIKQILNYVDEDLFQEEAGQEDGTTAHAIERLFFFLCKSNGYDYLPITKPAYEKDSSKLIKKMRVPTFRKIDHLIDYCKKYFSPEFKRIIKGFLPENDNITYPVIFKKNNNNGSRINLIIPTLEPEKIYGGISTALRLFKSLIIHNKFDEVRIIVSSDLVSCKAVNYVSDYFDKNFVINGGKGRKENNYFSIIPIKIMSDRVLDIKKDDFYVGSAWWTAELGFRIIDQQEKYFNDFKKLVYFIQDYEPIFYPHSSISAIAKSTYQNGLKTIAIINSEELYNYFISRFEFSDSYYVPFELNEKLKRELIKYDNYSKKEKIIICYGRPSTPRNCFDLIKKGLINWQEVDDQNHINLWKIYFVGEKFDKNLISGIRNAELLNKLSLKKYAELMKKASIGISLMESPHPSYPPIEMALFGVNVITNTYESKDLSIRNKNIYNLPKTNANEISRSLISLTREKNNNTLGPLLNCPKCQGQIFDPKKIFNK